MPPDSGLCFAYIPSYYYNLQEDECQEFIYGGCDGNANRFYTLQECNAKCPRPIKYKSSSVFKFFNKTVQN